MKNLFEVIYYMQKLQRNHKPIPVWRLQTIVKKMNKIKKKTNGYVILTVGFSMDIFVNTILKKNYYDK